MIDFKEQVELDNQAVFLNLSEFADVHDLNGVECPCVLEGDTVQQTLSIGDGINKTYPTIYGADLTVYVRKCDLESDFSENAAPVYGQTFTVDDELYLVDSVKENMGIVTIRLVANDR